MEMAGIALELHKPLAVADAGLNMVRFIRNHPVLLSGGFAALLSLRGRGIAGLAKKGWRLMYLYPAAISLGLRYLFPAAPSSGEVRDSEVDHSQE